MLIELWKLHLSSLLNIIWNSLVIWRTTTLLLLTLIILIYKFRKHLFVFIKKSEIVQHDKEVYLKSNSIMDERKLLDLLQELYGYDSYHEDNWHSLYYFMRYFEEVGNSYNFQKLEKKKIKLLKTLEELYSFVPLNFSLYPKFQREDNRKYSLHPEYNFDQEGDHTRETAIKFVSSQKELHKKVVLARKAYNDYRAYIKNNLKI